MHTLSISEAEKSGPKFLREALASQERFVLTDEGHEVLALIPISDLRMLEALQDIEDVNDARKALEEDGSISIDDFIAKYH